MNFALLHPHQRVVLSCGWQRHIAAFAVVSSQHQISVTARHVLDLLEAPARRPCDSHAAAQRALADGTLTVYSDLLDYGFQGHKVCHHPGHPLNKRAERTFNPGARAPLAV